MSNTEENSSNQAPLSTEWGGAGGGVKRCPKCGLTQSLDAFSRDKHKKDGRCSHCKGCIPIKQGGPHIIANIVFACDICNSSKGNRTPDQWTDRWYQRKK